MPRRKVSPASRRRSSSNNDHKEDDDNAVEAEAVLPAQEKAGTTKPDKGETKPPSTVVVYDSQVLDHWKAILAQRCATNSRAGAGPDAKGIQQAPDLITPIPKHCSPVVLGNDIARCLWRNLPLVEGDDEDTVRTRERERLREVVLRSLIDTPHCYYQGLHELLSVITLHGVDQTVDTLSTVARTLVDTHLFPFCEPSLDRTEAMLYAMHEVLSQETGSGQMTSLMEASGVAPSSHYAISWMVTWFTHSVEDFPTLRVIYDYCIDNDSPFAIVFLCAAIVLQMESEILSKVFEGKDTVDADDFGQTYALMSSIPKWPADDGSSASGGAGGGNGNRLAVDYEEAVTSARKLQRKWTKLVPKTVARYMEEKEELKMKQAQHRQTLAQDAVGELETVSPGSPVDADQGRWIANTDTKILFGVLAVVTYTVHTWFSNTNMRY